MTPGARPRATTAGDGHLAALPDWWPAVDAAAHAEADAAGDAAAAGRRTVSGITIDHAQSRDLDDALWLDVDGEDVVLHVSIADVASLVPIGSALDRRAAFLTSTRYHGPSRNDPMLPRRIAEGSATLLAGMPRPCVTTSIRLSRALRVEDVSIGRTLLLSQRRLTYEEADAVTHDRGHPLHPQLAGLAALATRLLAQRRRRGALVLFDVQHGWLSTEDGVLRPMRPFEAHVSYLTVQETMILANTVLARWAASHGVPILFRNHRARPAAPAAEMFAEDLRTAAAAGHSRLRTLSERVELVTERARYGATAAGHYALNLAAYSHSTSPIRRYADLVTQRQVTAALVGESPPYSAAELDAMADWIATVSDRWRAEAKRDDEEGPGAPAPSRRLAERNRALSSVAAAMAAASPMADDDIAAEVIERASAGTLSISHIAAILLGPRETWSAAQDTCLEHLRTHPDQAMSVLVMLPQRHGTGTPEVRLEATPEGYRAQASLHRGEAAWYGRWVTAITKRGARHGAALSLLHVVASADEVDVENPPPEDVESGTDGAALVISPPPPGNHKGALVEVAQQRQWRRPAFRLDQAGPPHAPVFRAWVKVVDGSHIHQAGPGLGRTRKAAEQVAAWLLLRDLALHDESDATAGGSPTSWLAEAE